jgi:tellurite resistance protein TerC
MDTTILFPFAEYWWFYLAFLGFIAIILMLDLGVFHIEAHEVKFKEAATWTVVWISLAMVFNYLFYQYALYKFAIDPRLLAIPGFNGEVYAKQSAIEFFTGFVMEKTLAVDNIFIFILVFNYFRIPSKYQHRILFYGIIGALVFRAAFIAVGSVLMQYKGIVIFFGVFLTITGIKMLFTPDKGLNPDDNALLKFLKRFIKVTPKFDGDKFFIKENGVRLATPLFVALIFLELTDIIFAIDSVPAIFALTKEPLIVFTSNIFAILGLRSMFFMLNGVMDKFHYLKYGLGLVLVFVGLKMAWLNQLYNGHFPINLSLAIIATIISISILASFIFPKKKA